MLRHLRWRAALALLAAIAIATPARAQGVQTGMLAGTARDAAGLVLPGVTVTVASPALQGERTTITDENGHYVLRGLPPGPYTVTFTLQGFSTTTLRARVDLGQQADLDAQLAIASVAETVNVVGEKSTVLASPQGGANYKAAEIDALATPRTLSGIAELAPGVTDNTPNTGQVTISGGFAYDNVFLVDGVDVNDNIFGDPDNLFIEDAIEETQVLTSGISAEYGRFTGGVVNAITKKGGDVFSGSFRANLTNPSWTDETPFEEEQGTQRPSDPSQNFEATFGGPILKSRVWFFAAGRYQDASESVALDHSAVQVTEKTTNKRIEGKVTGTLVPNQTVQVSYLNNTSDLTQRSFEFDMDPRSLVTPRTPNSLFVSSYRGGFGSRTFVEGQFSRKLYKVEGQGGTSSAITDSPFISLTPFGLYNAPYFDATDPEDRNNWQVTGSASYFLSSGRAGSHDLKVGVEMFESTNTGGNSQSSTDYAFWTDAATDANGTLIVGPDGRFVPVFTPGVTFVNNWQATRGAKLDIRTTSLYVHDRWAFSRHWSFDAGLRYERVRSEASGGIVGIDTDTVVPRLAATFDPTGNGDWVLQATYGHYAGKYSEAQFSANTTVGNPDLVQLLYVGPQGEGVGFAPGFDLANNYLAVDGRFNATNVSFEDSLSSAVSREFSASVGRKLGDTGSAKLSFVRRKLTGIVEDFIDLSTGSSSVERDGVVYGPFVNSVYRNTDEATRDYQALVLQGNYRVTSRWSLNGHWTLQLKNEGNFEGEATNQPAISSELGDYPEIYDAARHFPTGRLSSFQRNKVRFWTVYSLGLGGFGTADASLLYRYDSPLHYSLATAGDDEITDIQRELGAAYANLPTNQRVYFGERGSEQYDSAHLVDVAVNYAIPVFRSLRPWLKLEALNVFNNDGLIGWNTDVFQDPDSPTDRLGLHTGYTRGPAFGQAEENEDYPLPRTFRVSLGIRF
jgi:hypothetical protein